MGKIKPTLSERIFSIDKENIEEGYRYSKIMTYTHFENSMLHPSQFIAWDMENNCPLEKPEDYDIHDYNALTYKNQRLYLKDCKKYQQAEERILFEGFENRFNLGSYFYQFKYGEMSVRFDKETLKPLNHKTIADLGKVELTKNGQIKAGI